MAPSQGSPRKLRSSTSVVVKGKKTTSNSVPHHRPSDQRVSNTAGEISQLIANSRTGIWKPSAELKVVHLRGILKHYKVPKVASARRPFLVERYKLLVDENTQSPPDREGVAVPLAQVDNNQRSKKNRKKVASDDHENRLPLSKPRKGNRSRPQVVASNLQTRDTSPETPYEVDQLESRSDFIQDGHESSSDDVPLASLPRPLTIPNHSDHIRPQTTDPNLTKHKSLPHLRNEDGRLNPRPQFNQDLDETSSDNVPLATTSRPSIRYDTINHGENDISQSKDDLPLASVLRPTSRSNPLSNSNDALTNDIPSRHSPNRLLDPAVLNDSLGATTNLPEAKDTLVNQLDVGGCDRTLLLPSASGVTISTSEVAISDSGTLSTNSKAFSHFKVFLSRPADSSMILDVDKISLREMKAILSSKAIPGSLAHREEDILANYLDLCSQYHDQIFRKFRRLGNSWPSQNSTRVAAPGRSTTSAKHIQGPPTSAIHVQGTATSATHVQGTPPLVIPIQSASARSVDQNHPSMEPPRPIGQSNIQASEAGDLTADLKGNSATWQRPACVVTDSCMIGCKRSQSPPAPRSQRQMHSTSSLMGLHASELTPSQLKEILDNHQISYHPSDRLARIVNKYNELLSSVELETQQKVRRKQNQRVTRYSRPRTATKEHSRPGNCEANDTQREEVYIEDISPIYHNNVEGAVDTNQPVLPVPSYSRSQKACGLGAAYFRQNDPTPTVFELSVWELDHRNPHKFLA
ncbi:hypothetical protein PGTUg99_005547 [Puccinia graminis f. sp. tritici]|uniref:Uncharacterized protein n=1 Tax=Puccinia graminis f. sp. tritici TaxID=56615 RepID=A0A5B0M1C3_PUCGR|nr:hypothetical protein PGTUg99_013120 [Puccinia graminis f. sp. tritici]KAA1112356.1 hypothetical protein PGTUg99_005547 [Puccinia graminis f. sp. tritici]